MDYYTNRIEFKLIAIQVTVLASCYQGVIMRDKWIYEFIIYEFIGVQM